MTSEKPLVAVIGAGPAGLFAARKLVDGGARVVLFNRDIKPGGLAEYGIFFDKYKMKHGLRRQFRQIMELDDVTYFGNVKIGSDGVLTLDDVRAMGFDAVLVTAGAQGTKWLGLPGEELAGVYHAKDLVYHYNKLPPFSEQQFYIGRRLAVIGAGNVMLDIANWAVRYLKVDEIVAVVRRDPGAVKFTKKEMQTVAANLDVAALDAELARVQPIMEAVGGNPQAAREYILAGTHKADPKISDTRFYFDFLASPKAILGDDSGRVCGLEVEDTTLVLKANGETSARAVGTTRVLDVDTVIFAIGDRVDEAFGLPVVWNEFAKAKAPRFPVDGHSYEAYDPVNDSPLDGLFVAGWSREASTGLVGAARKDGENGAQAVLAYLAQKPAGGSATPEGVQAQLDARGIDYVTAEQYRTLDAAEAALAAAQGLEEFKYASNAEMLAAIHSARQAA